LELKAFLISHNWLRWLLVVLRNDVNGHMLAGVEQAGQMMPPPAPQFLLWVRTSRPETPSSSPQHQA
jgi:hypothetical protein